MTYDTTFEQRRDVKKEIDDFYQLAADGSLRERTGIVIKEFFKLYIEEIDKLKDRIKDLESNEKALQRQLRVLMPDRSDDI